MAETRDKLYTEQELSALTQSVKDDLRRRIIDELNKHCMCMDCAVKAVEVIGDL